MAAAFGGGSSQSAFGARGGATRAVEGDDDPRGAVHAARAAARDDRAARPALDSRWGGARSDQQAGSASRAGDAAEVARRHVTAHTYLIAEVAERQTHQLEGLAGATPWRFESSLPHHLESTIYSDHPSALRQECVKPCVKTVRFLPGNAGEIPHFWNGAQK